MNGHADRPERGSDVVYSALVDAGIDLLVGLPGTQTLPLDQTVAHRDEIEYVMARHETAIPHIAWGYYEAGGGVAATLTVPGPGDLNASHGLKNALDDNVPIIHISPIPGPETAGKHPIHEIEEDTFDNVVQGNFTVESRSRLREQLERALNTALTPPTGPVRLGVPSTFLTDAIDAPAVDVTVDRPRYEIADAVAEAADLLAAADRPLVYVGGGARRSPDGPQVVQELAARVDAPIAASYKGKGVVPEDADRFLGVTGSDLPAGARAVFGTADVVVALGTNFDGPNTNSWELPMGDTLVHVDLNPAEIDAVYESDVSIVADVSRACSALLNELERVNESASWDGGALATAVRAEYLAQLDDKGLLAEGPPIAAPGVLQTLREVAPRETVVTTDIGGHRIWSKNAFTAYDRDAFVTAGSWAGMGVGLPSSIGAALANPDRPVLTITGDGSLLMCLQELHTAVEHDLDITVALFNDADYGIISKSMTDAADAQPFSWESPEWVAIAEGFGCPTRQVTTRTELADATEWALETSGPALLDIAVDPTDPTPGAVAGMESTIDPESY